MRRIEIAYHTCYHNSGGFNREAQGSYGTPHKMGRFTGSPVRVFPSGPRRTDLRTFRWEVLLVNLMEDLRKARAEHRLDRRMRVYLAPKVLIVDEFGIWPYDRDSATAFFSLVSARYERGSIILTSNKGFAEWGELLGDTVISTAILDRLLHHSHVLNIRGASYRLKDKRQAGLLTSHLLLNPSSEETQNTKSQPGVGQY